MDRQQESRDKFISQCNPIHVYLKLNPSMFSGVYYQESKIYNSIIASATLLLGNYCLGTVVAYSYC